MAKATPWWPFALGAVALSAAGVGLLLYDRSSSVVITGPAPVADRVYPTAPVPVATKPAMPAQQLTAQVIQLLSAGDPMSQQAAVGLIEDESAADAKTLASVFPQLGPPLLNAKLYDELAKLCAISINQRSYDVTIVEAAQHDKVLALMAQGNTAEALKEAKAFYNVATLSGSSAAIDLLTQLLTQTGDASGAARFQAEQATAPASDTPLLPATNPSGFNLDSPPAGSIKGPLSSIAIDASPYADALGLLHNRQGAGGYSHASLMGQGDLLLLSDDPAKAKPCFEDACKNAGDSAKKVREAVEGVARCIRAERGSVAPANLFIMYVRQNPSDAAAQILGPNSDSPTANDLQQAALKTKLASVDAQ